MSRNSDLAAQIVGWLRRLGRNEVVERLMAPVDESRLLADLKHFELYACPDLIELYQSAGGTNVQTGTALDDVQFFPGFYWLSWDDSIANLTTFRNDARWNRKWLPLFANGGGDFYVVDCETEPVSCAVIGFLLGQTDHPIEYESVSTMLATILSCYEQGAFFVDPRGYLEMKDDLHAQIARAHNPSVSLWQESGSQ
jgi:hypothetical protein